MGREKGNCSWALLFQSMKSCSMETRNQKTCRQEAKKDAFGRQDIHRQMNLRPRQNLGAVGTTDKHGTQQNLTVQKQYPKKSHSDTDICICM